MLAKTSLVARSHAVQGIKKDWRRLRSRWARRARPATSRFRPEASGNDPQDLVATYLREHPVRKLQLGAGPNQLDGWLSTDLKPRSSQVLSLDAAKPFPLPDDAFDFIFAEHLIEHLSWRNGQRMLAECRRVLKPGGVLRLATPDLAVLIGLYLDSGDAEAQHYIRWVTRRYLAEGGHEHPVFVLNNAMRNWGHTFLYDAEVLALALTEAGFLDPVRCALDESQHRDLRSLESHGSAVGNKRAVAFETMALEAVNRP